MTVDTQLDINVSRDPLATLLNTVIGITATDGMTIRGRLIKINEKVIWLEKMSGDACMISRDDIKRLWRSRDCQAAV
jgi:hypothetical protein